MSFKKGEPVWVIKHRDPNYPEKAGVVLDCNDSGTNIKVLPGWENTPATIMVTASNSEYALSQRTMPDEGVDDMMKLSDLHVGALLHNLLVRFARNIIYTTIGEILVAVNPFQKVCDEQGQDLVGPKYLELYYNCNMSTAAPHTYAVADSAYQEMVKDRKNMSVVISGESGAGKSETTKHVLRYLAHRSATEANRRGQARAAGAISVEDQIVQTSLILEAFGNACTTRNNNSSRFGKFVQLQFVDGLLRGAQIQQYLLEKSRVVLQTANERNYHIFYDIFFYTESVVKTEWRLTKPMDYKFLKGGGLPVAPGINDQEDFLGIVVPNMRALGIDDGVQKKMFTVLAGILHMGQIEFSAVAVKGDTGSEIKNRPVLDFAAGLLGVNPDQLAYALCNNRIIVNNATIDSPLTPANAANARDALAKGIYSKQFEDVVDRINHTIASAAEDNWIGVLDIFGFEHFQLPRPSGSGTYPNNSFEQLCINLANEQLQSFFNDMIFKQERKVYQEEGVDVSSIEFSDNLPCVELINEVLSMLDEFSGQSERNPNIKDEQYLEAITRKYCPSGKANAKDNEGLLKKEEKRPAKEQYFGKLGTAKFKADLTDFVISHYAGDVQYSTCRRNDNDPAVDKTTAGFIDRNKDRLPMLLVDLVKSTTLDYLSGLFANYSALKTVGATFRMSLRSLDDKLKQTRPFFIRCVKPNKAKRPTLFENDMVLQQLRAAGMLETIRIRNAGFPKRMTPEDFAARYKLVARADPSSPINDSTPARDVCTYVLERIHAQYAESEKLPPEVWHHGSTRVFYKEKVGRLLEAELLSAQRKIDAIKKIGMLHVQSVIRMALERKALPQRVEVYELNKRRLQRIRELVALGKTKAEAEAIFAAEEEAERKRIEEEKRVAAMGPLEASFAAGSEPVAGVCALLDEVVAGSHDPEQKTAVATDKRLVDKAVELSTKAMKALANGGWKDEALLNSAKSAVAALVAIVTEQQVKAPAAKQQMLAFIAEEERLAAERARLEKERKEREERERAARARAAAIAAQLAEEAKARAVAEKRARKAEEDRVRAARERQQEMADAVAAERKRVEVSINAARAEHEQLERERAELVALKRKREEEAAAREAQAKAQETQRREIQTKKDRIVQRQARKRARIDEEKEEAKSVVLSGMKVLWKGNRATVRYCGRLPIKKSDDVWLGLEMAKPLEDGLGNAGDCLGIQLFRCAPNHGLFVRAEKVLIVDETAPKAVGTRVWVRGKKGVVRYVGEIYGKDGQWIGIELSKVGAGKNDGMVHEHRYFTCAADTGVFVRADSCDVVVPWSEEVVRRKCLEYCMERNLLTDDDLREIVAMGRREIGEEMH